MGPAIDAAGSSSGQCSHRMDASLASCTLSIPRRATAPSWTLASRYSRLGGTVVRERVNIPAGWQRAGLERRRQDSVGSHTRATTELTSSRSYFTNSLVNHMYVARLNIAASANYLALFLPVTRTTTMCRPVLCPTAARSSTHVLLDIRQTRTAMAFALIPRAVSGARGELYPVISTSS